MKYGIVWKKTQLYDLNERNHMNFFSELYLFFYGTIWIKNCMNFRYEYV